jgi:hypothetical protein
MPRKLTVISSLVLIAIAAGALIWTRSAQGLGVNPSGEAQAVRETILRAWRISVEAEYTFDTSKFTSVYVNDPRGGEITAGALDTIREIRQDPTIRMDQVGLLDYRKAAIKNLKRMYDHYMAELRAKQTAGTLDEVERLILEGETNGWPTPEPHMESAAPTPTQICVDVPAEAQREQSTGYPGPQLPNGPAPAYPLPGADYLESDLPHCRPAPTPTPSPLTLADVYVHYRGRNPATLPPEYFDMDIDSIEIEGDLAKAVVHKLGVTTEYVLVKVNGHWYIAGTKLLKVAF